MDDLDKYVAKRKKQNPEYWKGHEERYEAFKVGQILKMARKEAKMTQEEVARKMGTQKTAIARLENRASDMKVSTLFKFLDAVGKRLTIA